MSFVHLHVHSHYSLLDGLSRVEKLANKAASFGMPALALTDHGVMYGAIEFYNACHDAGIKPIIGIEMYISPRGMEDKDGKQDSDYFHLTLLAENYQGYLNLMKITSEAHIRGFYYKPRIDKATIKKYSTGVIALSGCPRGEIFRASENKAKAQKILEEYVEIFGKENFFIEVQRTQRDKTSEDAVRFAKVEKVLLELARENGLGVVATQDSHYLDSDDYEAQDVLVCIGTGRTVEDGNRLDMRSGDLSLKSPEQMKELFADIPEAIENTLKIAERCEVEIPLNQRYFAKVPIPDGETYETWLEKTMFENAKVKFGEVLPESVVERLRYEYDIICQKGFAPYFLMVADIAKGARSLGAVVTTRGSAAGSLIGFVMDISTIDPLYFQLPFERFLNPFRPTPPDIDLDISDSNRDAAIAWITEKYGKDKVAQIITFGTMQARASVRDVGRALGISYGKCDRLAKLIPIGKQGFNMTLSKALDISPELKGAYDKDPEARQILDVALKLEGGARHASIHAAALAIAPTPLTDYTPLQKEPDGERIITQYDMYSLDAGADPRAIGVVKMDLLGIRNLSILAAAVNLVEARRGVKLDIYKLPHPDPKTFELLSKGHTFGVFQLGGGGMTKHLKDLRPTSIFDIMAMVALYRPGPMAIIPEYIKRKRDPSLVSYVDPRMKEYLERSMGLLVYQDDVLLSSINLAGYTWEEADKFRKAMGKKVPEEMAKQKDKFIKGCVERGMAESIATELFTLIEPFAAYGFNKAHAASYAQVGYQTAYVKAHYPVEFMAALMSAESGDETKIYEAVEECKDLGIKVLPPDVYESDEDFTVVDDNTIRFGLGAIKNLGGDLIEHLLELKKNTQKHERLKKASILSDFVIECSVSRGFNKKSWEALVKGGALDRFGERGWLLAGTESILGFAKEFQKDRLSPQNSLFGNTIFSQLRLSSDVPDLDKATILSYEKEHLGLYVTGHPLEQYSQALAKSRSLKVILEESDGTRIQATGLIATSKKMLTKKQQQMAVFTLEDPTAKVEVLIFPKVFPLVQERMIDDTAVKVSARVSIGDGEIKLIADEIEALVADKDRKKLQVFVSENASPAAFLRIKQLLEITPGDDEVVLIIGQGEKSRKIQARASVKASDQLQATLKTVSGVLDVSL